MACKSDSSFTNILEISCLHFAWLVIAGQTWLQTHYHHRWFKIPWHHKPFKFWLFWPLDFMYSWDTWVQNFFLLTNRNEYTSLFLVSLWANAHQIRLYSWLVQWWANSNDLLNNVKQSLIHYLIQQRHHWYIRQKCLLWSSTKPLRTSFSENKNKT